jgi:hypothetical protein
VTWLTARNVHTSITVRYFYYCPILLLLSDTSITVRYFYYCPILLLPSDTSITVRYFYYCPILLLPSDTSITVRYFYYRPILLLPSDTSITVRYFFYRPILLLLSDFRAVRYWTPATVCGLAGPGIKSRLAARFSAPVQTDPVGPPSLPYNRYRVIPRRKAAGT